METVEELAREPVERTDLIVLGRLIGTYQGWDGGDEGEYVFYDFIPAPNVNLPSSFDLSVSYQKGWFAQYDDNGIPILQWDIMLYLSGVPRVDGLDNA